MNAALMDGQMEVYSDFYAKYQNKPMTTIKLKFRPSLESGRPGTVYFQLIHRRSVRQISTGYKLFPNEWDGKNEAVRLLPDDERAACRREMAEEIGKDMDRWRSIIRDFKHRGEDFSAKDMQAEFLHRREEYRFFRLMEKLITQLQDAERQSTAANYRAALRSFRSFCGKKDPHIEEITAERMEHYQAFLQRKGIATNSVSFYMRILRAVYNRAVEWGWTADRKPFRKVCTGIGKTPKRAVTIREMKAIKDLDLSRNPGLDLARDIFLFSFYCRGMSMIDLAFLRKSQVICGFLVYRRHKTGRTLHIHINSHIRQILEKYAHHSSPYLLPLVAVSGAWERKQYEAALRRINNALKKIAGMVGCAAPLTTYVARHAWASIANTKHIPVSVISDALGHDSVATTQIYLASIDASAIDRANDLVLEDL